MANITTQFTQHFSFTEMMVTNTGLVNWPAPGICYNLQALCTAVLEPARKFIGLPIKVNSGYRSEAVNKAVGGAKNSQHLVGEAADITLGSKELNKQLFEWMQHNVEYDQLIDEKNYRWIHVSYKRAEKNRMQILHLA